MDPGVPSVCRAFLRGGGKVRGGNLSMKSRERLPRRWGGSRGRGVVKTGFTAAFPSDSEEVRSCAWLGVLVFEFIISSGRREGQASTFPARVKVG